MIKKSKLTFNFLKTRICYAWVMIANNSLLMWEFFFHSINKSINQMKIPLSKTVGFSFFDNDWMTDAFKIVSRDESKTRARCAEDSAFHS